MHNNRLIIIPRSLSADSYDTDDDSSVIHTHEPNKPKKIEIEIVSLSRVLAVFLALEELGANTEPRIDTLEKKFMFMDSAIEKQLELLNQTSSREYAVNLETFKINLRNKPEEIRKFFLEIDYPVVEDIYQKENLFIFHLALEAQLLGFNLEITRGIVNANFARLHNIIKAIKAALPMIDGESEDESEGKEEEPTEIEGHLLETLAEFFSQIALLRLAKLNKLTYKI